MKMFLRAGLVTAVALLVSSCGGGGGSTGVNSGGNNGGGFNTDGDVLVQNNLYAPDSIAIPVGGSLKWGWSTCSSNGYGGQNCGSHSVTFDDGPASVTQSTGSYNRMFTVAGTYTYHCAVHGLAMSGKVVVQ